MTGALRESDLILLNAYLDGELAAGEQAALEQRLARDPALRQELEALRATVAVLKMAERVRAPRNFTLDPAVYDAPVSRTLWDRLMAGSLPRLAAAGAVAGLTLVCAAAVILSRQGGLGTPAAAPEAAMVAQDTAPAAAAQPMEAAEAEPEMGMAAEEPAAEAPAAEPFVEQPAPEAGAAEMAPAPSPGMGGGADGAGGGPMEGGADGAGGGGEAPAPEDSANAAIQGDLATSQPAGTPGEEASTKAAEAAGGGAAVEPGARSAEPAEESTLEAFAVEQEPESAQTGGAQAAYAAPLALLIAAVAVLIVAMLAAVLLIRRARSR